jgi:hypothetical protein
MRHEDYEKEEHLTREEKAFKTFIEDILEQFPKFGGATYLKQGKFDLDYLVEFDNGKRITAEIKGVNRDLNGSNFPPFVSIKKVHEMQRTVNTGGFDASYIIFAFNDGIQYQRLKKLSGTFNWFERKEKREGVVNDNEIVLSFVGTEFITKLYKS